MKSLISKKINFMKMKPNFQINMESSYLISMEKPAYEQEDEISHVQQDQLYADEAHLQG